MVTIFDSSTIYYVTDAMVLNGLLCRWTLQQLYSSSVIDCEMDTPGSFFPPSNMMCASCIYIHHK